LALHSKNKLIDSTINNVSYDSVLVFSTSADENLYTAQFSFVGPNLGNYILVPGSNNGTIYMWVAPIGNIPQGEYAPVVQLTAPQKTAMLTLGGRHQLNKKWTLESELAASNQDKNRFSNLNNDDNFGAAIYTSLHYHKVDTAKNINIDGSISYDYVHQNFRTINPFRNAEFFRNWNLKPDTEFSEQHLVNGFLSLSKSNFFKLKIQSEFLDNANGLQGFRQSANLFYSKKGFTRF